MDANSGFKQTYGIHFDYDTLYSIGVKEKELTKNSEIWDQFIISTFAFFKIVRTVRKRNKEKF